MRLDLFGRVVLLLGIAGVSVIAWDLLIRGPVAAGAVAAAVALHMGLLLVKGWR